MGLTAEEGAFLSQLKDRRIKLEHMMKTDGWHLFDGAMVEAERRAYEAASMSNDAWNGAKHHGAYHALRYMRSWMQREMDALQMQIQAVFDGAELRDRRLR